MNVFRVNFSYVSLILNVKMPIDCIYRKILRNFTLFSIYDYTCDDNEIMDTYYTIK